MNIKEIMKLLFLLGIICFSRCSTADDQELFPKADDINGGKGESRIDFYVFGDWGWNGSREQKEIAAQMALLAKKIDLDFIITTGDNFYENGVNSINDPLWKTNFESIYSDSFLRVPWYPTLGNHDYIGDPDAQVDYSERSDFWEMPARYYTYIKSIDENLFARFIAIDTEGFITQYNALEDTSEIDEIEQYKWLKNILQTTDDTFTIIYGHHGIYSSGETHGGSLVLQNTLKPLMLKHGVDIYFCGHDHHFEHARVKGEEIDYFVVGTGGALRPAQKNKQALFVMSRPGFLYVNLSADSTKFYFITNKGEVGYSVTKK